METHGIEMLVASVAALGAGPLLYQLADRWRGAVLVLHVALIIGIIALVAFHILPECVEMAGWTALLFAGLGLVFPIAAERGLHERFARTRSIALGLGVFALLCHEFTDGMALIDGHHGHTHGHEHGELPALGLAVVLHRLPMGAALYWMLRPHGRFAVLLSFGLVTAATSAGFFFGEHVLHAFEGAGIALFQAFIGGVLLHVVMHRHRDRAHGVAPAPREA